MYFALEEASWGWDGLQPAAYVERIEQLLDRLDCAREREEGFAASSELLSQSILGTTTLADLLWDPEKLPMTPEIRERITVRFGRLDFWDETAAWPAVTSNVDGEDVISPSSAYVHQLSTQGKLSACIALPGRWRGKCTVTIGKNSQPIHFVVDESTHRNFFRDAVQPAGEELLESLVSHAFPDVFCVSSVWSELGDFDGGYLRVHQELKRFLTALDDHGSWIFTDTTGRLSPDEKSPAESERPIPVTDNIVEKRFLGLGFDVAPEKPDVRIDGKCRRARERTVGGRNLYCEWHLKVEPHINRVHIHAPVTESGAKVVFAIAADHLPLP